MLKLTFLIRVYVSAQLLKTDQEGTIMTAPSSRNHTYFIHPDWGNLHTNYKYARMQNGMVYTERE